MSFEFTHPRYLTAFLFAAVLFWSYRRSLVDFPLWQRRCALVVRLTMFSLIVLSLAGPNLLSASREKMFVFLVDRSRSIDAAATEKAEEYLREFKRLAGSTPHVVLPLGESATELKTNIATSFETALATVPPRFVPNIVLLSDGNETEGDVLGVSARNRATVFTVPLPPPVEPEVQLAELRAPAEVRQGEPFNLDVVVESNVDTQGTIRIFRGPYKAVEQRKAITAGENVFRFRQTVDESRQEEFTATVQSEADTISDNNRASAIVFVEGPPRILVIDDQPKTLGDFAAALREQEIVVEIRPAEGVPRTLDELDAFDSLIISSVPASALTAPQMDAIRSYVGDLGGGFVMLGGEQSFGLGGYYRTPIEEILPLRCDFEKEQEKPSLGICLLLDRSGSMGGLKMQLTKEAAKGAVDLLTPRDFVAVIAFDSESYVISPMRHADAKASINAAISTIEAAGGTNIYPALVDAYEQLYASQAKLKHVILLTDGLSMPGDFAGIVRRMVDERMTVSTIGVGEADGQLLQTIAEQGQGRYYACDDPAAIPRLFAQETLTAGRSALRDQPFLPVLVTPTPVLAEIDFDAAPPLLGLVSARARTNAQTILAAQADSGPGEPLLAWWRYGLGMSVAFTSDVKSRWAAEWLLWSDYPKFWAQVVRHSMRRSDRRGKFHVRSEWERRGGETRLTLDLMDRNDRFINEASGRTTVIRPDSGKEEIALRQTSPGRYEASFPTKMPGVYLFQTTLQCGESGSWSQSRAIVIGYPDELRLRPINRALLERLAESSGGRFDPTPRELLDAKPKRIVWHATSLVPYLLSLAVLLFVLDVLLRRVEFRTKS